MIAEDEFKAWLSKYGRSTCDRIMRAHLRKRLDNTERPERIKVSLSKRLDMYARQSGLCGVCGKPMDGGNLMKLDADHIDPNANWQVFNSRQNLQLAHAKCNRSKGAKSLPEQAKHYGRTVTDILSEADV